MRSNRGGGLSMSTGSAANEREELLELLRDKNRRHHLASMMTKRGLAEQIREIRRARGWTQAELAQKTGKVQETISQLENPNYGNYTLRTLQRLAESFDVTLTVRFDPFSEMVRWMTELAPEDLAVPDYEHDTGLADPSSVRSSSLTEYSSVLIPLVYKAPPEKHYLSATTSTFPTAPSIKTTTARGLDFYIADPTPIRRSA